FMEPLSTIDAHYEIYDRLQRSLELFNVCATRINGLRKELVKTEMRIRDKNKFFHRLSKLGDLVFPQRKALINEVSARFIEDVEKFITNSFNREQGTAAL